jgi:hypothetical protein
VVEYGGLNFTSTAGLREEFMFSQFAPVEEFVTCVKQFAASFGSGS